MGRFYSWMCATPERMLCGRPEFRPFVDEIRRRKHVGSSLSVSRGCVRPCFSVPFSGLRNPKENGDN